MRLSDTGEIRKLCIALAMNLGSGYHEFTEMGIFELFELCKDYNEMAKEAGRKRR